MESIATLAIVAGIAADKVMSRFNLYHGVKSLHWNCSRCCDIDIQRTNTSSRANSRGASLGGNVPPQVVYSAPSPETFASRDVTPTVDELMRRVSIALAKPPPTPTVLEE